MVEPTSAADSNVFTVRGLLHQKNTAITEPHLLISLFLPSGTYNDLGGKAQGSLHALPDALSEQYKTEGGLQPDVCTWVQVQIDEGKVTAGLPGFKFDIEVEEVEDFEEFERRSKEWQERPETVGL